MPEEKTPDAAASLGDAPLACIYCTHTTENYADQDRNAQAGGVLQAARVLADTLNAKGVPAILCETVHDAPDWSKAYEASFRSIQSLKTQYPTLTLFVDVHRDSAVAGVSTRLSRQGESWAKMMFVVGSNQRLQHDRWQENRAFAQKAADLLEEKAPGIVRDVRVSANRYNQQISPQALLVEVGSNDNAQAEAERSAALLGEALAEILFAQAKAESPA
ncbi:MAG: stage II sporulation protein P [Firmicutes bacterium]|nr:stage II sporulation protein P [Bacillota bacterium]